MVAPVAQWHYVKKKRRCPGSARLLPARIALQKYSEKAKFSLFQSSRQQPGTPSL